MNIVPFSVMQELSRFPHPLSLAEARRASLSLDGLERLPIIGRHREAMRGPQTGIYFIWAETCQRIKIGRADDVAARMMELQCGSPDVLKLLWCYAAPADHERELHRQFHKLRSHGEWFDAADPLTNYIAQRKPGLYRPSRSRKAAA